MEKETFGVYLTKTVPELGTKVYHLYIGKYVPNFFLSPHTNQQIISFITDDKISEKVLNLLWDKRIPGEWRVGKTIWIGYVDVAADSGKKILTTRLYYPQEVVEKHASGSLTKLGIFSKVNLKIMADLKKEFPKWKIASTRGVKERRRKQLENYGIKPGKLVPVEEAHRVIGNYVKWEPKRLGHKDENVKKTIARRLRRRKFLP